MERLILIVFIILTGLTRAFAQVDCANIGFEQGSLAGWSQSYGEVTDQDQETVFLSESSGTHNNEHYVTSLSDGNDPKIPSIPMVAPGSTHSIRIGNVNEGGHYARLKANYTVTADNTLFQYKFAIVLQNTLGTDNRAVHEPYQKPGFDIQILDASGSPLPCSSYGIQLEGTNTVAGFQSAGDIQYRDWTTGAIDLRNFVGKTITIVVTAHGCTRRRHFGYAYFDAECLKSEITRASNCPDENGLLTLKAPEGFGKYLWNNGQSGSQIKVKANVGDKYAVQVSPPGSLDESCILNLDYTLDLLKSETIMEQRICEGETVAVGDTVYATTGTFVRNISKSNVCDSTVTLKLTVNPVGNFTQSIRICRGEQLAVGDTVYTTPGTYIKNIPQSTGCDSIVTTILEVIDLDLSVTPTYSMIAGDSVHVEPLVEPAGSYLYHWEQPGLSCTECPDPWASPKKSTNYQLLVTDENEVCRKSARVQVFVKPCGIDIPEAFSPNLDEHNEVFFVYGDPCVKNVREMFVYSRWGEVIYQKANFLPSDPKNGWDGKYQGNVVAAGAYPYKIRIELNNGSFVNYAGVVNLLR